MKYIRKFNEDMSDNRERELMLIALSGIINKDKSSREKIEKYLDKLENDWSYNSLKELIELVNIELDDTELEGLFLKVFNEQ